MEKAPLYLYEKQIVQEYLYKVYVDGSRLCFAKLPTVQRGSFLGGLISSLPFWLELVAVFVLEWFGYDPDERKLKKDLAEREQIERHFDELSQTDMEKLLSFKHHFAIDLSRIEKVVIIPQSSYEMRRGVLRFVMAEEEERAFQFIKSFKVPRIKEILCEACPAVHIEERAY
ncbi:hypothetical protein [Laceyella putida]|uniref:Uncharacterized protein n=1 Tax=Laceyella putida TaxID=110101 RepID=A0ABW2RFW5_9BACL